jgi:hypothetical protein
MRFPLTFPIKGLLLSLSLVASMTAGPVSAASDVENACTMMQEKAAWRGAADAASKKWRVPVPAILAVMRQESRFVATAAAGRTSAYGFAQVLDGTWNWYREATRATAAKRDNFADSADFIGWYMANTEKRIGLPVDDVASHYLVYHEGHVGYRSFRWESKPNLLKVADKVAAFALRYEEQLAVCDLNTAQEKAPVFSFRPTEKPFALVEVQPEMPRAKPIDRLVAGLLPAAQSGWQATVVSQ